MPLKTAIIRHLIAAMLDLHVHAAQAAPTSFAVRSVIIEQDGQWHGMGTQDSSPAQCAWFRQAREVTEHAWREELDWTLCSAAGRLATGDGRTLPWQLDQAGRAQVTISPAVSVNLWGPELPFRR